MDLKESFSEAGYAGPVPVLSALECRLFLQLVGKGLIGPPLDWSKGHAANSRAFYEIGTHATILEVLSTLLGGDILLWGASLVSRIPNEIHHWHTDIESSSSDGKTVAVWIGIENSARDSCLTIIPHSHRFGATLQQIRHEYGKSREEATSTDIVQWALNLDQRACLLTPEIKNGEALFFDGRLWHYSHNLLNKTRRASRTEAFATGTIRLLPCPICTYTSNNQP